MTHLAKATYYLVRLIKELIALFGEPEADADPIDRTGEQPEKPGEAS